MLGKKQIGLIAAASGLLIALYFLPKKPSAEVMASKPKPEQPAAPVFNISAFIDSVKGTLNSQSQQAITENEVQSLSDVAFYDSLATVWMQNKQPGISAYYLGKKASTTQNVQDDNKAGERYYLATRFANDQQRPFYFQQAILHFNKVLEKNPGNLEAKTNLGICYVEGSAEPMKGISALREVVDADSTNINAQLNLGLFAVQSGQYDKAIERFNKILLINPQYLEAYIYLGQTYASKGDKTKAIQSLEKYINLSDNQMINAEVNKYIEELKNS